MSSIISRVKMVFNSDKYIDDTQKATKASDSMLLAQITGIRRVAQVGISMAQMFGGFIDQTYALGIEVGLLSLELVASIQAVGVAATFGASAAFKGVFQAAAIISMLVTINNLRRGRADAARRSQGSVAAFRLLSF